MPRALLTWVQAAAAIVQFGLVALLMSAAVPAVFGFESFVRDGDLAVVGAVKATDVSVGDVVVYRRPQDAETVVVAHVLYVDYDGSERVMLQTRGDGDTISDQVSVTPRATLGRMAYRIPRVGMLVDLLGQPIGRVLLLGVPCVLLGIDYLRSRRRRANPTITSNPRVTALLDAGQRALVAGHPHLAVQAATGALALDPLNARAATLRSRALQALTQDVEYVAA